MPTLDPSRYNATHATDHDEVVGRHHVPLAEVRSRQSPATTGPVRPGHLNEPLVAEVGVPDTVPTTPRSRRQPMKVMLSTVCNARRRQTSPVSL